MKGDERKTSKKQKGERTRKSKKKIMKKGTRKRKIKPTGKGIKNEFEKSKEESKSSES